MKCPECGSEMLFWYDDSEFRYYNCRDCGHEEKVKWDVH